MKNLLAMLLVLLIAGALSGCATTRSLLVDNDDQLTLGKGTVVVPLHKVEDEWVVIVEDSLQGNRTSLVCPPHLLEKCNDYGQFDEMAYTSVANEPGRKLTLVAFK